MGIYNHTKNAFIDWEKLQKCCLGNLYQAKMQDKKLIFINLPHRKSNHPNKITLTIL